MAGTALFTFAGSPAAAGTNLDLFGGTGIIDMPSARMAPDGQISVGAGFLENTQRYNFGFQALPWLETGFRYTSIARFIAGPVKYYDRSFAAKIRLWDEDGFWPAVAVGANDLVGTGIYSGEYVVASKRFGDFDASLGIGWGRLGSANTFRNPFTLLSDSLAERPRFDIAGSANFNTFFHGPKSGIFGGLIWRTPIDGLSLLAELSSDSYTLERSRGTFITRSQANFGIAYQLDDTTTFTFDWLYGETFGGSFNFQLDAKEEPPARVGPEPVQPRVRSPEEQGAALDRFRAVVRGRPVAGPRPGMGAFVDTLWTRGTALENVEVRGTELRLTVQKATERDCAAIALLGSGYALDISSVVLQTDGQPGHAVRCRTPITSLSTAPDVFAAYPATYASLADLPPPAVIDARVPDETGETAIRRIQAEARAQQLTVQAISIGSSELIVYYTNRRYDFETDAVERLLRILMADAPPRVEKFRMIAVLGGGAQREFDALRQQQERSFTQTGNLDMAAVEASAPPLNNPIFNVAAAREYPNFSWNLFPQFRQELFDPENPFGVQFLAGLEGVVEIAHGLSVSAEVEASIYDNFNVDRPPDSVLPHVRSDFLRYFKDGKNGIGGLEADYRFRLAPEVYAIARAGYLESMFAGVGGEVLWRPDGQRWAIGADLYQVWQRNFDRLFGLQPYHILTGHISVYYASPWHGIDFAVHAGRYLAGDSGLTLEVSRRFATGVELGIFATKTNVSSARFGEGSFDKGIILRIPIGWTIPVNTQARIAMDIRPTQRDGGQRLLGDTLLFEETRRTSDPEIARRLDRWDDN